MLHPLWTRVRRALLVSTALVFAVLTLSTSAAQAQDVDWVITPEGLGPLQLGASIDDVIASLPEGHTIAAVAPVAADFEGRVVSVDGAVYAIVRVDDAGRIDRIVVLDDAYRSAEGVGPGSAITLSLIHI